MRPHLVALATLSIGSALAAQTATFARVGRGCGGSGGPPPLLNSRSLPRIGTTFNIDYTGPNGMTPVSDDRPNLLLGFAPLSVAIPMLTPLQPAGCTLLLQPTITIPMPPLPASTRYEASFPLMIPNDPSLLGVPFFLRTVRHGLSPTDVG